MDRLQLPKTQSKFAELLNEMNIQGIYFKLATLSPHELQAQLWEGGRVQRGVFATNPIAQKMRFC